MPVVNQKPKFIIAGAAGVLLLLLGYMQRGIRFRVIPEKMQHFREVSSSRTRTNSETCMEHQEAWNRMAHEYVKLLQQWDIVEWVIRHRNQLDRSKSLNEYIINADQSVFEDGILQEVYDGDPVATDRVKTDLVNQLRFLQERLTRQRDILKEGCDVREPLEIPQFE